MSEERKRCAVADCNTVVRSAHASLCERHYMRLRRHGHTDKLSTAKPGNLTHKGGYVLTPAPGHPRALGGYRAYEHRVVFYDLHGGGPFNCHWCGCCVMWDDMHVDHVDSNPDNNAPTNLVASCPTCNQARGHEKIRQTMRQRFGVTIDGQTRTLNEWARIAGISRPAIEARLRKGWDARRAVFEPRGKFGPKSTREQAERMHCA